MVVEGPDVGDGCEPRSGRHQRSSGLLVVDDQRAFADLLGDLLKAMGYLVDIATNGEDALALFRADPPAAVLLDLRMPGMNGPEIFDAIRRIDAAVPIIIVTGTFDEGLARAMLHRGAFDYVRKPLDVDHLEVVVAVATATPWHVSVEATEGQAAGSSAPPSTHLPFAVVGLVRHLHGPMHPGREDLEALALRALRESQAGRQGDVRDNLLAIRRLLDAGRLDWLARQDAEALRDLLDRLDRVSPAGPAAVYRIGCVAAGPLSRRAHQWNAFGEELRELGWIDGHNVRFDIRAPDQDGAAVDDLVADLARLDVDVIVGATHAAIQAAQRVTTTIPIVSTGSADPMTGGFLPSAARSDSNVTGVALSADALNEQRLQVLNEMVPGLSRIAIVVPAHRVAALPGSFQVIEAAAHALGMDLLVLEAAQDAALEAAFGTAADRHVGGVIVAVHETFVGLRARIADVAMRHGIPTISGLPGFAEAGGLAAYVPNATARYRQAARYVDKILRGATPAELPMEPPAKLDLFINLKTAKALGLTIPRAMLLRAERVIE